MIEVVFARLTRLSITWRSVPILSGDFQYY